MELGCDGVLVNTAIAKARKPILMAEAIKLSVQAGRKSYLSGVMQKSNLAKIPLRITEKLNNKIIFSHFFSFKIFSHFFLRI